MRRSLAAIAVFAVVAGIPATADAKRSRAKVLRATITPVGADAVYAGIHGKAQLVVNKRNSTITIQMRRLNPGTTYPWHIHEFAAGVTNPCLPGAGQGPIVTAFKYRALTARPSGNASSFGKARRGAFKLDRDKRYYVNVHNPTTGAPIACGVLKKKARPKPNRTSKTRPKPRRP